MHAVDETLGVFGAGELLFEMGEAEAGVDALEQDASKMLVALDDYGRRAGFVRCEGSSHARGAAADDDDVVIACFNLSHASSPPRRGVDALAQDAAKMLVALDDYGRRAGFVRCEGSSHARGAAADDDDVVIACFNLSHASSPPRRGRPCGRPGS